MFRHNNHRRDRVGRQLGGARNQRRCASGDRCWDQMCSFSHPIGWLPCTIDCQIVTCTRIHPPGRRLLPKKLDKSEKLCRSGLTCWKADCPFKHPSIWNPCQIGEFCLNYNCKCIHPPSRFLCRYSEDCMSFECRAVHPLTRAQLCDDGQSCIVFHCWGLHPHERVRPCRNASDCINMLCPFLHPTDRVLLPLPEVPEVSAFLNPTAQEYHPKVHTIIDNNFIIPPTTNNNVTHLNTHKGNLNPTVQAYIPHPHTLLPPQIHHLTNHLNPTAKEFIPPPIIKNMKKKEEEEEEGKKKEKIDIVCNICYDELSEESDKMQCNSKSSCHTFCSDCFIDQVQYQIMDENVGRFIKSNRRIVCSLCQPTNIEFDDTIIAIRVGSKIFAKYRKANEIALEVEVCKREYEKNQKLLIEIKENKKDTLCHRHRLYIAENILTLCCPRCKIPFIDFDGCFAVSCHACNCQFCAWCLKDCGNDAHPHVKICPNSLAPGGFYGQLSQFNTVHVTQRKKAVISYLEKLPYEEKIATQAVITNDLKDLGISIII